MYIKLNEVVKFKQIKFANCGPVLKGTVKRKKINVFFGPNNSGKSLISRLIHGVNSIPVSKRDMQPLISRYIDLMTAKGSMPEFYNSLVLKNSGINREDITTYGKKASFINIENSTKPTTLNFSTQKRHSNLLFGVNKMTTLMRSDPRSSIYIPAGRAGTIQFFTSIAQIRNRLLGDLLQTFGGQDIISPKHVSAKEIRQFTKSLSRLPDHLEQFHELILSTQTDGLNTNTQKLFSELFPGSIEMEDASGFAKIRYKDPTGFTTEIESAGSGTVSTFPILVGMYYVKKGGTLIVEEPEAHLEPSRQLGLMDILQTSADQRNINLIFTTHSDYVIKKLLAMVSSKKIKHTDLGLYYFDRVDSKFTTIREINVDKTGEAEQPLFSDALDTLVKEFSI